MHPRSIDEAFCKVCELEDGWYNGSGFKYDAKFIACARAFVASLLEANCDVDIPFVTPDPDGDLLLEWVSCRGDASISVGLNGRAWLLVNTYDGGNYDEILDVEFDVGDAQKVKEAADAIAANV